MMKKVKLSLMAIIMALVFSIDANAVVGEKFQDGNLWYEITSNGKVKVSKCEISATGEMNIPSEITHNSQKYTVTEIGRCAFEDCEELTAVVLPNSVTKVDFAAFAGCRGLKSLELGNALKEIGISAFTTCEKLVAVDFPNSLTTIGGHAFYGCTNLKDVKIPDTVVAVGGSSFEGTVWFDEQPDGIVYVGRVAYQYKGVMPEKSRIVIKEGTVGVSDFAFYGCKQMVSLELPSTLQTIGETTFTECTGLESVVLPASMTYIAGFAFSDCSKLKKVYAEGKIPAELGKNAFGKYRAKLYVPVGAKVAYKDANEWNRFGKIIEKAF